MKTSAQKRLARLAGLLLLSLLVFATGIQAAQAAAVADSGAGSGTASSTAPHQLQGLTAARAHQHDQGVVVSVAAVTATAGTQGRGGVALAPFTSASGAQPASSSTSSTTAWIAAGSAAAALIVGFAAWALIRRRRQPGEFASATYCAQHPEDSLCMAA
jgi:hypothetical protein